MEAKNRLDSPNGNDNFFNHFVKPPANLIVLEGDCLDSLGDGTELESYLVLQLLLLVLCYALTNKII